MPFFRAEAPPEPSQSLPNGHATSNTRDLDPKTLLEFQVATYKNGPNSPPKAKMRPADAKPKVASTAAGVATGCVNPIFPFSDLPDELHEVSLSIGLDARGTLEE